MDRPFKRSPFFSCVFFSSTLAPYAVSFHFLSGLCTPSLESAGFFPPLTTPPLSFPCPHALTVWISLVHVRASVFLPLSPSPSLLSWVISLSYVCPSLYVCVPPLFVSDSFSREIRDAYLVLLSSTGGSSAELHRAAMASSSTATSTHHVLIILWSVSRARCGIKSKAASVHWAVCEFEASTRITVIDYLIDWLTLFNV